MKMNKITVMYLFCFVISTTSCINGVTERQNQNAQKIRTFQDSTFYSISNATKNKELVESLILRDQRLDSFPDEIVEFKNLRFLDLSMNNFSSIPAGISELKNLEELVIAYSKINEVPNSIKGLKNLKRLVLLYSQVEVVDKGICDLIKLVSINLSFNQLNTLPDCICQLESLKELNILYRKGSKHISQDKYVYFKECLKHTKIAYEEIGVQ